MAIVFDWIVPSFSRRAGLKRRLLIFLETKRRKKKRHLERQVSYFFGQL